MILGNLYLSFPFLSPLFENIPIIKVAEFYESFWCKQDAKCTDKTGIYIMVTNQQGKILSVH